MHQINEDLQILSNQASNLDIHIHYEDDQLAILWKPAGIQLAEQVAKTVELMLPVLLNPCPEEDVLDKPVIVKPVLMDKAAQGLAIAAKTNSAKEWLINNWEAELVCLCHGKVPSTIRWSSGIQLQQLTLHPTRSSNESLLSLCRIFLRPSLTTKHQYRLDLDKQGHPIIGQAKHCRKFRSAKGIYSSIVCIKLKHPVTKELMKFEVDLPDKFNSLIKREGKFWEKKEQERQAMTTGTTLPVAYALGKQSFCGVDFKVDSRVMIPKLATETLVKVAVELCSEFTNPRIMDMGTGSGNILLSVLRMVPHAHGIGFDISEDALQIAKENQANIDQCEFVQATFDDPPAFQADIIICNPPYLDQDKKESYDQLMVSNEPGVALFTKNFESYKVIAQMLKNRKDLYHNGSYLVLEIPHGSSSRIEKIFPFKLKLVQKDQKQLERCLVFCL